MRTSKMKSTLLFCVTYFCGVLFAGLFLLSEMLMVTEVRHRKRLPWREKKMVVAINHPTVLEALYAPLLFVREWILSPRIWGPWSTPDTSNTRNKWYWFFWMSIGRAVLMPRGDREGLRKAFARMLAILRVSGRVIIFPEGGRTWKSREHLFSPKKGKKLRPLKSGVGRLVSRTGASVLPIWVEYAPLRRFFRKAPVTVKIGDLMRFHKGVLHKEVTMALEKALLALADEGED